MLKIAQNTMYKSQITHQIRGMILKFWSLCDISVTCDATCLKILPHNNIFFVYTLLWHVSCNIKERPEIYPKTVMPSMHWPINQTVHVRGATLLTSAVSAFRFYGCSMIIRNPNMFWRYGELSIWFGFSRPLNDRLATVGYNQI